MVINTCYECLFNRLLVISLVYCFARKNVSKVIYLYFVDVLYRIVLCVIVFNYMNRFTKLLQWVLEATIFFVTPHSSIKLREQNIQNKT